MTLHEAYINAYDVHKGYTGENAPQAYKESYSYVSEHLSWINIVNARIDMHSDHIAYILTLDGTKDLHITHYGSPHDDLSYTVFRYYIKGKLAVYQPSGSVMDFIQNGLQGEFDPSATIHYEFTADELALPPNTQHDNYI